MRHTSFALVSSSIVCLSLLSTAADAQGVGGPGQPWRGAGTQPCFGAIDAGANKCPAPAETVAIRAGHLFDSNTGQMRADQTIVLNGERIVDVGPSAQVKIPRRRIGHRPVASDRASGTD